MTFQNAHAMKGATRYTRNMHVTYKAHAINKKPKCADRYAPPITGLENQTSRNGEHKEESTLKDASHEKNVGNKSVNRKIHLENRGNTHVISKCACYEGC
jgi:hypothetical protein